MILGSSSPLVITVITHPYFSRADGLFGEGQGGGGAQAAARLVRLAGAEHELGKIHPIHDSDCDAGDASRLCEDRRR